MMAQVKDVEPNKKLIIHKISIFGWQPTKLQWLVNFVPFLTIVCINAFFQGAIVNGLVSTSISSIEKRFKLTSTQSGVFAATYDIFVTVMLLPLALYATKVNKVRSIGYGMLLVAVGSLVIVLPQFMGDAYAAGELKKDLCDASRQEDSECTHHSTSAVTPSFLVLLISQAFVGIGASPLFTYGYSCIDEFDSHKKTGRNMAIYMSSSTVGPAVAFMAGGASLSIWGDLGRTTPEELGITERSDPRWYGAWWLGFLVCGVLALFTATPLIAFPKKLNDTDERKKGDAAQTHSNLNYDFSNKKFAFFRILFMFLKNPTVMSIIIMQTLESMIMNGYITFVPKLLETLFGYSSGMASTITGAVVVPMGVLGSYMGGQISKYLKNRFKPSMLVVMLLTVTTAVCSVCLIIRCQDILVSGINADVANYSSFGVHENCANNCQCDNLFNPVCSEELKLSFLSPCHASCNSFDNSSSMWKQCSCAGTEMTVTKGWCHNGCTTETVTFFVLFSIMALSIFACAPMMQSSSLRVVHHDHRDQFICFGWLFMRVLGSIPGAIVFGYIIDVNCLYWQEDCDGKKCQFYDSKHLGLSFFLFTIFVKIACICLLAIAYFTYQQLEYDATEENESKTDADEAEFSKRQLSTIEEKSETSIGLYGIDSNRTNL